MAAADSVAPGYGKMAGKQFDNLLADDKQEGEEGEQPSQEEENGEDQDLIGKATD